MPLRPAPRTPLGRGKFSLENAFGASPPPPARGSPLVGKQNAVVTNSGRYPSPSRPSLAPRTPPWGQKKQHETFPAAIPHQWGGSGSLPVLASPPPRNLRNVSRPRSENAGFFFLTGSRHTQRRFPRPSLLERYSPVPPAKEAPAWIVACRCPCVPFGPPPFSPPPEPPKLVNPTRNPRRSSWAVPLISPGRVFLRPAPLFASDPPSAVPARPSPQAPKISGRRPPPFPPPRSASERPGATAKNAPPRAKKNHERCSTPPHPPARRAPRPPMVTPAPPPRSNP